MKSLIDYTGGLSYRAHYIAVEAMLADRHRILRRVHLLPAGRKRLAAQAAYEQSWDILCAFGAAWRRKQLATVVVRVRRDPSLAYQLREALDAARAEGLKP